MQRLLQTSIHRKTSKVIALKKLDRKAKLPATIFTYSVGVVFSLILGVGMCLSMKIIGSGNSFSFALGIVLGIIGIAGVSVNYPVYKKLLESRKQKYAADIIQLASEISAK